MRIYPGNLEISTFRKVNSLQVRGHFKKTKKLSEMHRMSSIIFLAILSCISAHICVLNPPQVNPRPGISDPGSGEASTSLIPATHLAFSLKDLVEPLRRGIPRSTMLEDRPPPSSFSRISITITPAILGESEISCEMFSAVLLCSSLDETVLLRIWLLFLYNHYLLSWSEGRMLRNTDC